MVLNLKRWPFHHRIPFLYFHRLLCPYVPSYKFNVSNRFNSSLLLRRFQVQVLIHNLLIKLLLWWFLLLPFNRHPIQLFHLNSLLMFLVILIGLHQICLIQFFLHMFIGMLINLRIESLTLRPLIIWFILWLNS